MNTQLPPHNLEAEQAILGGLLLDPEAIGRINHILTEEAFYSSSHKQIYKACVELEKANSKVDLMTVTSWLQDHDLLEKIGGITTIARLVETTVSSVNIDHYAKLVMEKYYRRQLIQLTNEIADLAYDQTSELREVFDETEAKIFSLTQDKDSTGLTSISDTLVETFNTLESRQQNISLPGIPSGFYDLDKYTSGFSRSDLIILAARPAMGKTSYGLNIAVNIAKQGLPVAIFSLEMSKEQLSLRLLSAEAEIESHRLRTGKISENELEPLSNSMAELSNLSIFIDDTASLSVSQMRSQVRRLKQEKGELGLILVDYLQLMEGGGENRVQELSKISRALKVMAREINVPVIALSQLSRAVEQRNNKRPMLSDLRDSGAIEQDADIVLMLYRDAYYNPDSEEKDLAECIIAKHRNGATGTIKLLFKSELTRFENILMTNY